MSDEAGKSVTDGPSGTVSARAQWGLLGRGLAAAKRLVASRPQTGDLGGWRIITTGPSWRSRQYDAETGQEIAESERVGDGKFMAFCPDGRRIVTFSWNEPGRVWDASSGAALPVLRGDEQDVRSAAFSPDGRRIITDTYWTARLWDADSGRELGVRRWADQHILCCRFDPAAPGLVGPT